MKNNMQARFRKSLPCSRLSRCALTLVTVSLYCSLSLANGYFSPGDRVQVVNAARAIGLNAETLACLDVHGSEPALVLDRLNTEFNTYIQYEALQGQIETQQEIAQQARLVLRDSAENADAQSALDDSQGQIVLLSNQMRSTRMQLISSVLDGLADASLVQDVLAVEGLYLMLPPEYRLAVESPNDAKDLAWALQMQEIADGNDSELHPSAQQILQHAHAQSDVQTAKARVDAYTLENTTTIEHWMISGQ